jgi:thioredoxin-like negative regulator of GroEL
MLRLLEKYSNLFWDIQFFAIEKNDVQPNGFVFRKNPTIVFIENGKTVKEFYGVEPQIKSYIEEFSKDDVPESKEKQTVQTHKVYELKDIPSYSEAYQKLLAQLKKNKRQIQNISTFLDEKKGVLVVTVDFEAK